MLAQQRPTRRQLREAGFAAKEEKPSRRRSFSRTGILATLAVTTLVVPLTGFVGPDSSVAVPERAFGAVPTEQPWDTTADNVAEAVPEAEPLRADPGAASRARIRAGVSGSQCEQAKNAANGDRMVGAYAPEIVIPLGKGSYSFSSPFGFRVHPVLGVLKMHEGADLASGLGNPVYSMAAGVVESITPSDTGGAIVRIKHRVNGETVFSQYLHMYAQDVTVHAGEKVKAGQRIGAVGNAGRSTGPHLHFEVRTSGDTPVDPTAWLKSHGASHLEASCL